MKWVFLSPHLDDVVLSSGGMVWQLVQMGDQVDIVTICAGKPAAENLTPFAKELHQRWGSGVDAVAVRLEEDRAAVACIGANAVYLDVPDCIYRYRLSDGQPLIQQEEDLFLAQPEMGLVARLAGLLKERLSLESKLPQLVSPFGIGRHVDHRLTRSVAEQLEVPVWYYVDYPYILRQPELIDDLQKSGWISQRYPVPEAGYQAWQDAVAAYQSQISTFWGGEWEMREAIGGYWAIGGGCSLWRRDLAVNTNGRDLGWMQG